MIFASQQWVLPSNHAQLYSRAATTTQNLSVKTPRNMYIIHKYLLCEEAVPRCLCPWRQLGRCSPEVKLPLPSSAQPPVRQRCLPSVGCPRPACTRTNALASHASTAQLLPKSSFGRVFFPRQLRIPPCGTVLRAEEPSHRDPAASRRRTRRRKTTRKRRRRRNHFSLLLHRSSGARRLRGRGGDSHGGTGQ